jgi:hypothetical protein
MVFVLTANEVLEKGLELVGFDEDDCRRVRPKRNNTRFIEHFGCKPSVCAVLWCDLQTTNTPAARITPKSAEDVKKMLFAIYYLRNYPKEKLSLYCQGSPQAYRSRRASSKVH